MRKLLVVLLYATLMVNVLGVIIPTNTSAYTTHDPIYINGNADFTPSNGVTGGSGTESDPYIIEGWDINAPSVNGIEIRNTDAFFIIRNCYVHDGQRGIYFYNVTNGWIKNTNSSNNGDGIHLKYSHNNTMSNNSANSNSHDGIRLDYSNSNSLYNNTANSNSNSSIHMEYSSENSVFSNNVSSYYFGISLLYSSNNNNIWHNNLVNNINQAYDQCTNYWDDEYPSGGNYWSDYTGVDEKSGPNQDQPGSDGIGDTPYIISGDSNQDRYPLMIPRGGLITHSTIYINGNENFTKENGVTGGTGTENDPYIIQGWDINASSANGIEIRNSDAYFIIRNCYIYNGGNNHNKGIYIYNVQNGQIENLISSNNHCGIQLHSSSYNNILKNDANTNDWDGIWLYYSNNNNILNNTVSNNNNRGIQLYYSNYNNILNNKASNNSRGIYLDYSDYNTVSNDTASNNNIGIYLHESVNNKVLNNSVSSNNDYGIYLGWHSSNNNISNNTASGNNRAIWLLYSDYNTIFNNSASNNGRGIHLEDSDYNTIFNNTISNGHWGIYLYKSSYNNIYNNSASKNSKGIYLYFWSVYNTISNNSILNNSDYGIHLQSLEHNTISDNSVLNNNYGIYLYYGMNNDIYSNDISENYYGFYFFSQDENRIYHNNFVDNVYQAFDTEVNQWDDGYPSGGNYWSDYNGTDEKSGPNQDEPGSDGIGDTPYNISGGSNQDHYPLMTPWNMPPIATPTNLTANATGNSGEIELDWDNNTEANFDHYSVYRRNDGDWQWIDNTTMSYYLDTGLIDSVTYHYYVTASDNVPNESDPSNEVNATPYSGVPVADAGPDQESFNGRTVNFDGSNSYDPDGTIVNWTWDFGDGTVGYGEATTHVYSNYSVYNVILTVKDNDGRTGIDIAIVTIWQNGHDLSILKVQSPHNVRMGSTKTVVVWVENLGIYNDYGLLSLTITAPDGTKTILTTIVKEKDGTSLNIGNKVRITFSVTFNQRGTWTFYAHVDISDSNGSINPFPLKDCNPANNNGEPTHGTDCR